MEDEKMLIFLEKEIAKLQQRFNNLTQQYREILTRTLEAGRDTPDMAYIRENRLSPKYRRS
jgi:hypothetical protein